MTRDKEEKALGDALLCQRLKEIVEPTLSDPLYGVSQEEEAIRRGPRVAEKYRRAAG